MTSVTILGSAEPASTRWNDYVGTVAADDPAAFVGGRSLYELTGLDRDHWIVVGLDVLVTAAVPEVVVYAAARGPGGARVEELVDPDGNLPVMAYSIVDPDRVETLLNEGFGQLSIRLRPRGLDHPLRIIERGLAHDTSPLD